MWASCLCALGLVACAQGGGGPDAGTTPTPRRDAGTVPPGFDAGPPLGVDAGGFPPAMDSGSMGFDAGPFVPPGFDAGRRMDAMVSFDAGADGGFDAGFDSGLDFGDGPLELPSGWVERASATFVPTFGSNGLGIASGFQVGWRFEIPAGMSLRALEIGFHDRGGMGTIFGAIVRLDGSEDGPDTLDLSSADVISAPTLTSLLGHRGHVIVDTDVELAPGWYALVFGGDLIGAMPTGDRAGPAFGHTPVTGEQTAFSISGRTGELFQQREGARFFVRGTLVTP